MTRRAGRERATSERGEAGAPAAVGPVVSSAHLAETGMPALVALAMDPGDEFAFFADETPAVTPTISGSADATLMELARQLDEAGR